MKRIFTLLSTAALAAALGFAPAAQAADAAAGRALVKRYADAIVGVELVVTIRAKFGEREAPAQERRIEVNGTVISPTGLTVASLAQVDPQSQYDAMRAAQGGRGPELTGVDFKEVKLRLADGKELPARFVLKDADLDLAFIAPETADAATTFAHVKLDEAVAGEVLGDYFYVSRMPKALQRTPVVRATEITGIIEKPRRIYLVTEQSLGTPVFEPQGRVVGLSLQYFSNGRMMGAVILPAADIADMAKQAAAAQAPKTP